MEDTYTSASKGENISDEMLAISEDYLSVIKTMEDHIFSHSNIYGYDSLGIKMSESASILERLFNDAESIASKLENSEDLSEEAIDMLVNLPYEEIRTDIENLKKMGDVLSSFAESTGTSLLLNISRYTKEHISVYSSLLKSIYKQ